MELRIFDDYQLLSRSAAEEVLALVKLKPGAVLCLATGDSPLGAYQHVVSRAKAERIDFSHVQFVALDEWVGISPANSGSCNHYLRQNLLDPLNINGSHAHFFDALSDDLEKECQKMDAVVIDAGGIDLMLVGVGMNGHVGFNEPGISADHYCHVVSLDESTRTTGQKYFTEAMELKQGITLGLKHFMESRSVLMLANGKKKAAIMRQALETPASPGVPASIIRKHAHGIVMLDKDAASLLRN